MVMRRVHWTDLPRSKQGNLNGHVRTVKQRHAQQRGIGVMALIESGRTVALADDSMTHRALIQSSGKLLCIFALALMASGVSAQKIYKYVDRDGNTIYSQNAPQDVQAVELKPRVQKVDPKAARAQLEALGQRAREAGDTRRQRGQIAAQDQEAAKREKQNCDLARKNIQILNGGATVQTTDASGNVVTLTEEAQAAKLRQAQAQVDRYCR